MGSCCRHGLTRAASCTSCSVCAGWWRMPGCAYTVDFSLSSWFSPAVHRCEIAALSLDRLYFFTTYNSRVASRHVSRVAQECKCNSKISKRMASREQPVAGGMKQGTALSGWLASNTHESHRSCVRKIPKFSKHTLQRLLVRGASTCALRRNARGHAEGAIFYSNPIRHALAKRPGLQVSPIMNTLS